MSARRGCLDLSNDSIYVAVAGGVPCVAIQFCEDIGDVTWGRTDVQHGSADAQDVVNFAGVNDSDERLPHDNQVQVRSRQRTSQGLQRLIRGEHNVAKVLLARDSLESAMFAAAAHETEHDSLVRLQASR